MCATVCAQQDAQMVESWGMLLYKYLFPTRTVYNSHALPLNTNKKSRKILARAV